MYNTLVAAIPSVVFTLFLGSWSDRHGRKFPMAFSLVGFILSCAMSIPVAFLQINPLFLLISAGLSSIFGGWPIFIASIHSYIGDYTTEKNRAAVSKISKKKPHQSISHQSDLYVTFM
jgi:MFS transporter, PCFT/HCP family, solute carrier family 46 (folate transporter), member 1